MPTNLKCTCYHSPILLSYYLYRSQSMLGLKIVYACCKERTTIGGLPPPSCINQTTYKLKYKIHEHDDSVNWTTLIFAYNRHTHTQ